jgi:hypothetical protein
VFSCRDNDNTDEILEKKNTSYDVYIAGRENSKACYWKNTVKTDLSNGDGISTINIKVENNDIYVTGISLPNTTNNGIEYFWKNNVRSVVKQYLNIPNNVQYNIKSFAINNGDVYFTGYVENPAATSNIDRYELCYWKNGIKNILYKSQFISKAESIFINGSDIYVSTVKVDNNQNVDTGYFKNNVFNSITANYIYNFAKNNDGIHILYQKNAKNYSKNINTNLETLIGDYMLYPIPTYSKIISHNATNDLYTIETSSGSTYFKNSSLITPSFSTLPYIQDIFILDNNIYMIKYIYNNNSYNAKLFINGLETQNISSSINVNNYFSGTFNSLYVVEN